MSLEAVDAADPHQVVTGTSPPSTAPASGHTGDAPLGGGARSTASTPAAESALDLLRASGSNPILLSFPRGAIIVFDHDLRYLCAGGMGLADVGLSRELLEGRTIFELFPSEVVEAIAPLYRSALAGEESEMDVDYGGRTFLQRLGPLYDSAGAVIAGMGFTQDVTAARQSARDLTEESRRLRDAEAIGRVGSWDLDLRTQAVNWSEGIYELYGLQMKDSIGDYGAALHIIHGDDQPQVNAAVARCAADGTPMRARYRIRRADDGQLRWIDSRGEAQYEDGQRVRIVGAIADVTDHVVAAVEAEAAQAFHEAVIDASPDLIFVYDMTTRATTWSNRSELDQLGYGPEQLGASGAPAIDDLVLPEERGQFDAALESAANSAPGEVVALDHRLRAADGTDRWFSRRVTALRRDDDGRVLQLVGVLRDITDAVEAEQHLRHSALHDNLTGLPNRALLTDRLESALARLQRTRREMSVLFCDLDGFKRVNDTGGHAAGDQVLLEMARRLQAVVRDGDTVARIGGDEFVVVVEPWNREVGDGAAATSDDDRAVATRIADRIREAVRRPTVVNGTEHVVSASIGIAYGPRYVAGVSTDVTGEQLLQDADAAMYRAKGLGKDRFEVFRSSMRTDGVQLGRVEQMLRRALRPTTDPGVAGGVGACSDYAPPSLSAAFQPIFSSATGALVGIEALARLADGYGVAVPPDVFIKIAEDIGVIGALDTFVLDLACQQLTAWRAQRPEMAGVVMSVNISALHVQHAGLADDVHDALRRNHLAPGDLMLELTETALLDAGQSTIATLRSLHDEGIGIAIDDFGTGYASLRYLATLPISVLKIDRSFTAGLPDDQTCRKIVNAVAGLAADLDLSCIVEGVETVAQRDALPAGVQLQGYLLGRPQQPDHVDLHSWLHSSGLPSSAAVG